MRTKLPGVLCVGCSDFSLGLHGQLLKKLRPVIYAAPCRRCFAGFVNSRANSETTRRHACMLAWPTTYVFYVLHNTPAPATLCAGRRSIIIRLKLAQGLTLQLPKLKFQTQFVPGPNLTIAPVACKDVADRRTLNYTSPSLHLRMRRRFDLGPECKKFFFPIMQELRSGIRFALTAGGLSHFA